MITALIPGRRGKSATLEFLVSPALDSPPGEIPRTFAFYQRIARCTSAASSTPSPMVQVKEITHVPHWPSQAHNYVVSDTMRRNYFFYLKHYMDIHLSVPLDARLNRHLTADDGAPHRNPFVHRERRMRGVDFIPDLCTEEESPPLDDATAEAAYATMNEAALVQLSRAPPFVSGAKQRRRNGIPAPDRPMRWDLAFNMTRLGAGAESVAFLVKFLVAHAIPFCGIIKDHPSEAVIKVYLPTRDSHIITNSSYNHPPTNLDACLPSTGPVWDALGALLFDQTARWGATPSLPRLYGLAINNMSAGSFMDGVSDGARLLTTFQEFGGVVINHSSVTGAAGMSMVSAAFQVAQAIAALHVLFGAAHGDVKHANTVCRFFDTPVRLRYRLPDHVKARAWRKAGSIPLALGGVFPDVGKWVEVDLLTRVVVTLVDSGMVEAPRIVHDTSDHTKGPYRRRARNVARNRFKDNPRGGVRKFRPCAALRSLFYAKHGPDMPVWTPKATHDTQDTALCDLLMLLCMVKTQKGVPAEDKARATTMVRVMTHDNKDKIRKGASPVERLAYVLDGSVFKERRLGVLLPVAPDSPAPYGYFDMAPPPEKRLPSPVDISESNMFGPAALLKRAVAGLFPLFHAEGAPAPSLAPLSCSCGARHVPDTGAPCNACSYAPRHALDPPCGCASDPCPHCCTPVVRRPLPPAAPDA